MYSPTYKVKTTRKVKTRQKLNEYETFAKNQPEMPEFTCPHIDEVIDWAHKIIDKMEELRSMNTKLRDNAEYWKVSAEEMQEKIHQHTELCEKIQKLISD
jgi:hypothetical protein|tara:strand:- start:1197 stop:1496 length:300 start_codon:yes stop_codon:yes gene_type:complete